MKRKKILALPVALLMVVFLTFSLKERAESQIIYGFISVESDCYTYTSDPQNPQPPVDVGDSNNCTISLGMCADNSCPDGTQEVQRQDDWVDQ